jgi:Cytochrome P450
MHLYFDILFIVTKSNCGSQAECSVLGNNGKDGSSKSKRIPTIKDVSKLEYTIKVFRESMRLYPPASTIGRQAIKDQKVDKYVIPTGSIICQYVVIRITFLIQILFTQISGLKRSCLIFPDSVISHLGESNPIPSKANDSIGCDDVIIPLCACCCFTLYNLSMLFSYPRIIIIIIIIS